MQPLEKDINNKSGIVISRNSPIALVVGAAGFIGSHITDALLDRNIQVIGIDNFSTGSHQNISDAIKNKNFHLINQDIEDELELDLPRIDYAFLIAEDFRNPNLLTKGLRNFLQLLVKYQKNPLKQGEKFLDGSKHESHPNDYINPKILFTSSIDLYQDKLDPNSEKLKNAEIFLAKFAKEHNLNCRIVRLGSIYGPRMHFRYKDPIVQLIQSYTEGELINNQVLLDFTTRALFISDCVNLLLKTVFLSSTNHKIYDGVLFEPIKVEEVRQILLDPLWFDNKGFTPTQLPPWLTPNIKRTMKELSWKPKVGVIESLKKTVSFFKENTRTKHDIVIPTNIITSGIKSFEDKLTNIEKSILKEELMSEWITSKKDTTPKHETHNREIHITRVIFWIIIFLIITSGLIYPIGRAVYDIYTIKPNLLLSKEFLEKGDFKKAKKYAESAQGSIRNIQGFAPLYLSLQNIGLFKDMIESFNLLINTSKEGIDGVSFAVDGIDGIYKATKVVIGEDSLDLPSLYKKSQLSLDVASLKMSKVAVNLSNEELSGIPNAFKYYLTDLRNKFDTYRNTVEQVRTASYILPVITSLEGSKQYLILLQNNFELRPTGGFIGSYAKIKFENGKIKDKILVDDIYNLDGSLKEYIEPPIEIKNDLGQNNWYLRDSNFEPDFPTSARQAEFFYKKESGEAVQGVIAMDLVASAKLIKAVGGLDLSDYGETITEDNLFEKVISHAEVDFFPGSQAKKNYLATLQNQLFNKMFLSKSPNWSAIISALIESLEEKHLIVYFSDPELFSYVTAENWGGVIPREGKQVDGETNDLLAVVESNMGANKSNYYLSRSFKLNSTIGKEGQIAHRLLISYKNNSPAEVFPAGTYKNRFRIYLPHGTKLTKAEFGDTDITLSMLPFNDYGRSGYSTLIPVAPKEQKDLILEYQLGANLNFKNDKSIYKLDVVKQAGITKDPFEWTITYPLNYKTESKYLIPSISPQELMLSTNLQKDRSFIVDLTKK